MTDHTVKVSVDDDIASIILDRGEVRNALNRDTIAQLRDAALAVSDKDRVRAVIIRAEGTDFSVGADLKEVSVLQPEGSLLRARRDAELGQKLLTAFREIHQPTICAVQGIATGGGACIAAACDFRIATTDARLGLGEVKVGMNLLQFRSPVGWALRRMRTSEKVPTAVQWRLGGGPRGDGDQRPVALVHGTHCVAYQRRCPCNDRTRT